ASEFAPAVSAFVLSKSVSPHKAPVDAVLPAPHPRAFHGEPSPGGHGIAATAADKGKRARGRAERLGRFARERAAQIARENRPLPDGKDAGFRPGLADHG